MLINPRNVVNLLLLAFSSVNFPASPVTDKEKKLTDNIKTIITQATENVFAEFDIQESLDFEDPYERHNTVILEDNENKKTWFLERYVEKDVEQPEQMCSTDVEDIDFDYKRRAVQYWKSGRGAKLKLSTVQHRFRNVESERQLRRWSVQISKGGTHKEKLKKIAQYTLNSLIEALDKNLPVHDVDIQRWALQARDAEGFSADHFKASKSWITKFKEHHRIVSRKITKFVSKKNLMQKDVLEAKATQFVNDVKKEIEIYGEENVYNSDQSGFNLEIHTGRTLQREGIKTVEAIVQSKMSTTHSYTIQPLISASGKLMSPLLIVLYEPSGSFGPRVEEKVFRPENVYILPSRSGKLTTDHFKTWLKEIYIPNTGKKTLLLLDSWNGQCPKAFEGIDSTNNIKLLTIPAGTTGLIQPLDVYGFRVWKNFIKRFSDLVILHNYNINLHIRNNIIKLQSLTHNQFSSPRFVNLFKYSWFKSGYIEERPPDFENPVEYCYRQASLKCDLCDNVAIIRCAWCKKSLCFKHFFDENHYCTTYHE